ncbi:MAG: hypothetical protein SCM11_16875 [Bacillota bacterium]|nr:hypothetical protein [Bacillota bacterium]
MSAPRLAYLFAGCYLGAGFVSGREIWQFYGRFGVYGALGLLVSAILFPLAGVCIIRLAQISGIREMDKIVVRKDIPWLRRIIFTVQIFFLFSIVAIMIAGSGALVHQLYAPVPAWTAGLIVCLIVALVAMNGLKGVASAFSICVPILVIATVCICIAALRRWEFTGLTLVAPAGAGRFEFKVLLVAMAHVSYNVFGSIGILAPFGELIPKSGTVYRGMFGGSLFLMLVACSVFLALMVSPSSVGAELPMLDLACWMNPVYGYGFGVLLLIGLFGTALALSVALGNDLRMKFKTVDVHYRPATLALIGAAFVASLTGFGKLISLIYPVFGYLGMLLLTVVFLNYRYYKKKTADSYK